jgi:predicted nucleic acid-binding protein
MNKLLKHIMYIKKIPVRLVEVNIENALKIACQYNICAYDAYYLEAAFRLRLPLLTLNKSMKNTAREMNLNVLEERNENI